MGSSVEMVTPANVIDGMCIQWKKMQVDTTFRRCSAMQSYLFAMGLFLVGYEQALEDLNLLMEMITDFAEVATI